MEDITKKRILAYINRSMKYLHRLTLIITAFAFLVLTLYFLWAVYHSTRGVTPGDIEPVQKSLQKVDASLQEDGNEILKQFRENREKLENNLEKISKQTNPADPARQETLNNLNSVVSALSLLQTRVDNNRDERQAAIKDSLNKLESLRKGLEPAATPEKIIGLAITRTFNLVIQLAWPLVALAVFLYLFISKKAPARLASLFSNFKSVELFSAKFEMGERVKFSAEESFENFRKQAKNSFDHWVQKKALEEKVRGLLNDPDTGLIKAVNDVRAAMVPPQGPLEKFRCTIHVPDLLFAETFYQLLDYIPRQPGPETRGRTWSFRFGFIGKLWRSEKQTDIWTNVPTDTEQLINNWGMTKEEAENAGKGRQSFLGVMLVHHSVPVGLFYIDAEKANAFGTDTNGTLRQSIKTKCEELEITKDLADIAEELRGSAALIRIYSQR
jgi:hypothetical protein